MRKLRVISDGTMNGTRVEDAATGEVVLGVRRVTVEADGAWRVDHSHEGPRVVVELEGDVAVDVIGEPDDIVKAVV